MRKIIVGGLGDFRGLELTFSALVPLFNNRNLEGINNASHQQMRRIFFGIFDYNKQKTVNIEASNTFSICTRTYNIGKYLEHTSHAQLVIPVHLLARLAHLRLHDGHLHFPEGVVALGEDVSVAGGEAEAPVVVRRALQLDILFSKQIAIRRTSSPLSCTIQTCRVSWGST